MLSFFKKIKALQYRTFFEHFLSVKITYSSCGKCTTLIELTKYSLLKQYFVSSLRRHSCCHLYNYTTLSQKTCQSLLLHTDCFVTITDNISPKVVSSTPIKSNSSSVRHSAILHAMVDKKYKSAQHFINKLRIYHLFYYMHMGLNLKSQFVTSKTSPYTNLRCQIGTSNAYS